MNRVISVISVMMKDIDNAAGSFRKFLISDSMILLDQDTVVVIVITVISQTYSRGLRDVSHVITKLFFDVMT